MTAMSYAVQMVPAGRSITGVTSTPAGAPYVWVGYGGDASKVGTASALTLRNDKGTYYTFQGTTVALYVFQISSYGGAPTQAVAGTVTYAIVTPNGWIVVDTQPTQ